MNHPTFPQKIAIIWFGFIVLAAVLVPGCMPKQGEQPEYPPTRDIPLDDYRRISEITIDGCQYLTATDIDGKYSAFTHKGNCKNHPGLRSKGE